MELRPPLGRDMIAEGRSDLVLVIVDPVILTRAEKGVLAFKVRAPVEVHAILPPCSRGR